LYLGNGSDFPYTTTSGTLATLTNLVDAVAYSNHNTNVATNLMAILNLTVSTINIETSTSVSKSIQRKNDGTYEVKAPTPGVNNDGSGIVLNYVSVSTSQTSYNEGDNFNVVFTTSQPVTTSNLNINFTLNNGNFNNSDYSGNLSVTIPVGQTSAQTNVILTDDSFDEGDEEMLINVQPLSLGYVSNNNNIIVRVYDNDFIVQTFGTPINPTYNIVTPTIPTGYYDSLEGLSGNALKQAVQDIIAAPTVRLHSYADIWDIIRTADQNPENSNQIWDMYLEIPMAKLDQQTTSSIVGKWNREHIFCQSRGGFEVANGDTADGIGVWNSTSAASVADGVSDAHHIRAENGQENSSRNNKNYGTVNSSTVYAGPSGTQGSWRGDVARALFYMAVRFDGLNVVNGDPSEYLPSTSIASGNIGDLATLLVWNHSDPKDDFEMNRNNYIYTWQMNRNPFIDYPLLVDYIFGANFGQPWSSSLSIQNPIENRVAVYPNPTTDYIIVAGLEGNSKVEIYTITGQMVQSQNFENEIRINIDLNAGMYLVKVSNGFQSTTKKIIVK
jgi:endonuclease I